MLRLLFLVAVLSFVAAREISAARKLESRIWNGQTANQNQFPYMAGILIPLDDENVKTCGGALISPLFVLTAAHCVDFNSTDVDEFTEKAVHVALGMHESFGGFTNGQQRFKLYPKDVILHPLFDINEGYHDIALIKLPKEVTLTRHVHVISLPSGNQILPAGLNITTPGYGDDGDNNESDYLKYMVTQVVPGKYCTLPDFDYFQEDKQICVNGTNVSMCKGDSGSPNVIITNDGKHILVGVTSRVAYSVSCEEGVPQILTRLSHYLPWIKKFLDEE